MINNINKNSDEEFLIISLLKEIFPRFFLFITKMSQWMKKMKIFEGKKEKSASTFKEKMNRLISDIKSKRETIKAVQTGFPSSVASIVANAQFADLFPPPSPKRKAWRAGKKPSARKTSSPLGKTVNKCEKNDNEQVHEISLSSSISSTCSVAESPRISEILERPFISSKSAPVSPGRGEAAAVALVRSQTDLEIFHHALHYDDLQRENEITEKICIENEITEKICIENEVDMPDHDKVHISEDEVRVLKEEIVYERHVVLPRLCKYFLTGCVFVAGCVCVFFEAKKAAVGTTVALFLVFRFIFKQQDMNFTNNSISQQNRPRGYVNFDIRKDSSLNFDITSKIGKDSSLNFDISSKLGRDSSSVCFRKESENSENGNVRRCSSPERISKRDSNISSKFNKYNKLFKKSVFQRSSSVPISELEKCERLNAFEAKSTEDVATQSQNQKRNVMEHSVEILRSTSMPSGILPRHSVERPYGRGPVYSLLIVVLVGLFAGRLSAFLLVTCWCVLLKFVLLVLNYSLNQPHHRGSM